MKTLLVSGFKQQEGTVAKRGLDSTDSHQFAEKLRAEFQKYSISPYGFVAEDKPLSSDGRVLISLGGSSFGQEQLETEIKDAGLTVDHFG